MKTRSARFQMYYYLFLSFILLWEWTRREKKTNRISVWAANQSFQLKSFTCITANSFSNRHGTVSCNPPKRRGWELGKPFRNTIAFPRAPAEPPLHHQQWRTIPLRSAKCPAHKKQQKSPDASWYVQHRWEECHPLPFKILKLKRVLSPCWVHKPHSPASPAPALPPLPQRSVKESVKPHWNKNTCGGVQAFRAWTLKDFLCSGSTQEDVRLSFLPHSEMSSLTLWHPSSLYTCWQ